MRQPLFIDVSEMNENFPVKNRCFQAEIRPEQETNVLFHIKIKTKRGTTNEARNRNRVK